MAKLCLKLAFYHHLTPVYVPIPSGISYSHLLAKLTLMQVFNLSYSKVLCMCLYHLVSSLTGHFDGKALPSASIVPLYSHVYVPIPSGISYSHLMVKLYLMLVFYLSYTQVLCMCLYILASLTVI